MNLYKTPTDACINVYRDIQRNGTTSQPRGMEIRETLGYTFKITMPWQLPVNIHDRKLNHGIGIIEALNLVGQTSTPEKLVDTAPVFERYIDTSVLHGAYGPRIHGHLHDLVQQIERDNDTRQAVLTIYNSAQDLNRVKNDIPCTIALQYFIRDNRLHAHTMMRSNDVYLGLPYDLYQFITMQAAIAAHFDIEIGEYTHTAGSMHLYKQHYDQDEHWRNLDTQQKPAVLYPHRHIAETSQRARQILNQQPVTNPSLHEQWMINKLA